MLWVEKEIAAEPTTVWDLLVRTDRWPHWGPTVRRADTDGGRIEAGSRGTVTAVGGVRLPFRVTDYRAGRRWRWSVAGVPATAHRVEPLDGGRSRVGFGVPVLAAPYLGVCRLALRRLDRLATGGREAVDRDP